eukprot:3654012-Lingulodinium_polyedra.AAC.1
MLRPCRRPCGDGRNIAQPAPCPRCTRGRKQLRVARGENAALGPSARLDHYQQLAEPVVLREFASHGRVREP